MWAACGPRPWDSPGLNVPCPWSRVLPCVGSGWQAWAQPAGLCAVLVRCYGAQCPGSALNLPVRCGGNSPITALHAAPIPSPAGVEGSPGTSPCWLAHPLASSDPPSPPRGRGCGVFPVPWGRTLRRRGAPRQAQGLCVVWVGSTPAPRTSERGLLPADPCQHPEGCGPRVPVEPDEVDGGAEPRDQGAWV